MTQARMLHLAELNAHLLDTLRMMTSSLRMATPFLPTPAAREAAERMVEAADAIINLENAA